ncbi:MAG: hypothetical protein IPK39_03435 [Sulfuritalea sp.]|nr:hypothetical protein [Sulfuritalea sp.]
MRESMLATEANLAPQLKGVAPAIGPVRAILRTILRCGRAIAGRCRNGWRRLAVLARRAESHVLANLDKVLGILHRLTGQAWQSRSKDEPVGIQSSQKLLEKHTAELA